MEHFQGVTPEERYKNDILSELRRNNYLLEQNAQLLKRLTSEKETQPKARQRGGGTVVNAKGQ